MANPYFVAIGEIGLDYFIPELCTPERREKQIYFFREQLQIAKDFGLPVLLHVRRSVDHIIKYLRRLHITSGIAHAFNGSEQQANMLINLGFKLGFGGALTYARALQIRRLATTLPLTSIVLETDAPDMSPHWLHGKPNSPEQLPQIAAVLAELRGISLTELANITHATTYSVLPRLNLDSSVEQAQVCVFSPQWPCATTTQPPPLLGGVMQSKGAKKRAIEPVALSPKR